VEIILGAACWPYTTKLATVKDEMMAAILTWVARSLTVARKARSMHMVVKSLAHLSSCEQRFMPARCPSPQSFDES
jgi:hypothetical protein